MSWKLGRASGVPLKLAPLRWSLFHLYYLAREQRTILQTVVHEAGRSGSEHTQSGTTVLFPNFLQHGLDLFVSIRGALCCSQPASPISRQEATALTRLKTTGKPPCSKLSFVLVPCLVSGFCKIDEFCLKASADRQTDLYLLLSI